MESLTTERADDGEGREHAQTDTSTPPPLTAAATLFQRLRASKYSLAFKDKKLEAAYHHDAARANRTANTAGLLAASFVYTLASLSFSSWAWNQKHAGATASTQLIAFETASVGCFSLSFLLSFTRFAARRPQAFAACVMLAAIGLVQVRATTDVSEAFSAPLLLVLIVSLMLGGSLLRLAFVPTLCVSLVTLTVYAVVLCANLSHRTNGSGWYPVALAFVGAALTLAARQLELARRQLFLVQLVLVGGGVIAPATADVRGGGGHAAATPLQRRLAAGLLELFAVPAQRQLASPFALAGGVGGICPADDDDHSVTPLVAPTNAGVAVDATPKPTLGRNTFEGAGPHSTISTSRSEGSVIDLLHTASGGLHDGLLTPTPRWGGRRRLAPDTVASSLRGALRASVSTAQELPLRVVERLRDLTAGVTQGANSVEAVQVALEEAGSASLHEFLSKALTQSIREVRLGGAADSLADDTAAPPRTAVFELVDASKLPRWHTPYPYIQTGYRARFTYRLSFASLFRLHNETLNVWTELAPAVGFGCWAAVLLERHAQLDGVDRAVLLLGVLVVGVLRNLCSGLAHLLHATTAQGYIVWWSCDYASICLAILATSIVYGRLSFYCMAPLQIVFFTCAAGLLSTTLVAVLAVSSAGLRAMSFILFAVFCSGAPFVYQLGVRFTNFGPSHGLSLDVPIEYLALWGGSIGAFLLGLVIKTASFPERLIQRPWSDLFFASHHWWHMAVNGAFALNVAAWDIYFNWRIEQPPCPAPG